MVIARHDRTKALQLKHYHRSNATISSKPMKEIKSRNSDGISTISDFDWTLPTSVRHCRDAILNFATVNRSLWPFDTTDIALMKVFDRYDWCSSANTESNRIKLISSVFNRVMEDNTYRAADKEHFLSYEEIEKILKETLIDNGMSAEVQSGTSRPEGRDRSGNMEGRLASLENKLSNNKERREPKTDISKALVNGREICYKFNSKGNKQNCYFDLR